MGYTALLSSYAEQWLLNSDKTILIIVTVISKTSYLMYYYTNGTCEPRCHTVKCIPPPLQQSVWWWPWLLTSDPGNLFRHGKYLCKVTLKSLHQVWRQCIVQTRCQHGRSDNILHICHRFFDGVYNTCRYTVHYNRKMQFIRLSANSCVSTFRMSVLAFW